MSKPTPLMKEELELVALGEHLQVLKAQEGWKILEGWLKDRAFHSWVDPRGYKNKEDWVWAELNAYHSADVAKQILEDIEGAIATAEGLKMKEAGQLPDNLFDKIYKKLRE